MFTFYADRKFDIKKYKSIIKKDSAIALLYTNKGIHKLEPSKSVEYLKDYDGWIISFVADGLAIKDNILASIGVIENKDIIRRSYNIEEDRDLEFLLRFFKLATLLYPDSLSDGCKWMFDILKGSFAGVAFVPPVDIMIFNKSSELWWRYTDTWIIVSTYSPDENNDLDIVRFPNNRTFHLSLDGISDPFSDFKIDVMTRYPIEYYLNPRDKNKIGIMATGIYETLFSIISLENLKKHIYVYYTENFRSNSRFYEENLLSAIKKLKKQYNFFVTLKKVDAPRISGISSWIKYYNTIMSTARGDLINELYIPIVLENYIYDNAYLNHYVVLIMSDFFSYKDIESSYPVIKTVHGETYREIISYIRSKYPAVLKKVYDCKNPTEDGAVCRECLICKTFSYKEEKNV